MTRHAALGLLLAAATLVAARAQEAPVEPPAIAGLRQMISDGQYAAAETAARALVQELDETPDGDPVVLARALDFLAEALWRGGKSKEPECLAAAERALALKESALGPDDPRVADSLKNLALVLRMRAEPDGVLGLLQRALAIQEVALGPDDIPAVLKTLNALGNYFNDAADYAAAEPVFLRALELSETLHGPEARQVAVILVNLASLYQESGAFEKAVPVHQRSIAIMEAVHGGHDHPEVAFTMNAYANTLGYLGEHQEARRLLEQALEIRERTLGPDHRSVAATLNNLSIVLQDLGDLASARPLLERAVAVWEAGMGPDHPLVAQGYNNLATLITRLGDLTVAEQYLRRALATREEQLGPEHPLVAQTLHNLGKVHTLNRDDEAARTALERTIAIWTQALGDDNPFVALARESLGDLLREMGDLEGARAQYELALAIREPSLGDDHPQVAETLAALGELDAARGATQQARTLHLRALGIREAALGKAHPESAMSRTLLAAAEFDLGRFDDARAAASAGARTYQQSLRSTLGALSEREALLLLGEAQHPEVTLFSGLLADHAGRPAWLEACWSWTLGQRGLVLQELADRRRTAQIGTEPEAGAAWSRLIEARRLLAATWVRGAGEMSVETYRQRLDQVTRARDQAEIEMARVSARFRQENAAQAITLADLSAALPPDSALVEIVRVPVRARGAREQRVHDIALILNAGGKTDFADLGPAAGTDDRVARWRRALDETAAAAGEAMAADKPGPEAGGFARMLRLGAELRRAVWRPIRERAQKAGTVFLVPDGSLHQINLAALPDDDGVFLMENGPSLHLLGAARDLARRPVAGVPLDPGRGRGVLLVGAPDFDASPDVRLAGLEPARTELLYRGARTLCTPAADTRWPGLPQAAREVQQVAGLFGDREAVTVLSGPEASEERLKLEAPGKRILHLATHGYFLQEQCDTVMRESPLLLSGLVLAGANRAANPTGADDGVLTAEEVTALDLRGVDLAVLSACDTGRGRVETGEGVFGLRRSLELAGARTVVMSVWPVPDREARRWMTAFYEAVLAGTPVGEATRRASLAGLARLRENDTPPHPYFWGGFVVAGDWR